MFIRNALTVAKQLTVVQEADTIEVVLNRMASHLSLPCLDADGRFVGMISKRTIFDGLLRSYQDGLSYEDFLKSPVSSCVDRSVPTLTLDSYFEDTIEIVIRYPFVPIVQDGTLIGIVKRSDVHRALSIAFATNNVPTQRLLLGMADVEGALQRIFSITHRLGINVVSAVTFDARRDALNRRMILKVSPTPQFKELCAQLEKSGFYLLTVED